MPDRNPDVDRYLAEIDHPDLEAIEALRLAILESDPRISESVKWNAPNFRVEGEDRVTFRLKPGNRFQMIFHRGAAKRDDSDDFEFVDPTGQVEWAARDRGTLTLAGHDGPGASDDEALELVRAWVAAT